MSFEGDAGKIDSVDLGAGAPFLDEQTQALSAGLAHFAEPKESTRINFN